MFQFRTRPSISQRILSLVETLIERIQLMSNQLDTLTADVTQNTSVVGSAVQLLTSLKTQLDAAIAAQKSGDDGAALAALSTSLEQSNTALAGAVAANTPAATTGGPVAVTPAPTPDGALRGG